MNIERIRISHFRAVESLELFPQKNNVLLGPNNTGKTAVLEALNLLLNPDFAMRSTTINENDFYGRIYKRELSPAEESSGRDEAVPQDYTQQQNGRNSESQPEIRIEAVLSQLTTEEEDFFRDHLVPWKRETREVVENADAGVDPFDGAVTAIRVAFQGRYDSAEDDFACRTFFVTDPRIPSPDCRELNRGHKRQIGFLIYRDFRALTKPVTLEPYSLFGRLLSSQAADPRDFDSTLSLIQGALAPVASGTELSSVLIAYRGELERYLHLSNSTQGNLSFELTDRTRQQIRETAQLHVHDEHLLPLQKMGAGTRSLAILAILTLIMRRRGRGILALEEPETFLFPHAQRRVIDECLEVADQTFITTHSPYVLERIPAEGIGRLERRAGGILSWRPLNTANVKHLNLYAKRIRQSFCEALLGKGVVIVEGDSDRWWIHGASRIMNRRDWAGRKQEALELQGICVVSADTNSDIARLGHFFHGAGVEVVCLADRVKDTNVVNELCDAPFSTLFLRYRGLEELLAAELDSALMRECLTNAPHPRGPRPRAEHVAAASEDSLKEMFYEFLTHNKGSAQFHEWLISYLDEDRLPRTLKDLMDLIAELVARPMECRKISLL
jgi:putative ATP-dependent endonuclease of OLD family